MLQVSQKAQINMDSASAYSNCQM